MSSFSFRSVKYTVIITPTDPNKKLSSSSLEDLQELLSVATALKAALEKLTIIKTKYQKGI